MTDQSVVEADRRNWALAYNEKCEQLEAMTKARDLSKAQTAEVAAREQALLRFLRDEHPETYEAWAAFNAWG